MLSLAQSMDTMSVRSSISTIKLFLQSPGVRKSGKIIAYSTASRFPETGSSPTASRTAIASGTTNPTTRTSLKSISLGSCWPHRQE
ncbi:hypothetical protein B0H34DRAFT_702168 [Crassisporium funariophilum]|nr:hypothetical protein B0H34DRAFT_702168 [Crassisporium funariophilum]